MSKTTVGAGSPNAQHVQAAGLFFQSMQRNGVLNSMAGKVPRGEAGVAEGLRKQSTTDMPIVRCEDLTRGKGDEVEFHFVQPVNAYPIMGNEIAEGKGVGINLDNTRVRVNQVRFPVDLGNAMTDIRSPVEFRKIGRPIAQSLIDSYQDQVTLTHLAGARGFHNNSEWRLPTADHPKFAEMAVNPVKAPSKNRHFIADGDAIKPFALSSTDVDLAATDLLTMDTVDSIRTVIESIALPPPAIKLPEDKMASDSPLRCLLVSPAQYHSFAADPNFRQFQASALARAAKAGNHPLFAGEVGLWNGILISKIAKPIRFYAGDTIKYCAAHDSETESNALVPTSFGTTHAVDRALLLGGQALAQAFGKSKHGGLPFFWKEKSFDHDDKDELLIGAILGMMKLRWLVEQGDGTSHYTDHGVIAIDTAVPIIGARK